MTKIIILIIGIGLIAFIAWWFLGKHDLATGNAKQEAGKQVVDIEVKGGYSPEKIVLQRGVPATLNFKRTDSSSCLDHVVFADFGINQALPEDKQVAVKIDPEQTGEYDWSCGMNMFHGKLIVM